MDSPPTLYDTVMSRLEQAEWLAYRAKTGKWTISIRENLQTGVYSYRSASIGRINDAFHAG